MILPKAAAAVLALAPLAALATPTLAAVPASASPVVVSLPGPSRTLHGKVALAPANGTIVATTLPKVDPTVEAYVKNVVANQDPATVSAAIARIQALQGHSFFVPKVADPAVQDLPMDAVEDLVAYHIAKEFVDPASVGDYKLIDTGLGGTRGKLVLSKVNGSLFVNLNRPSPDGVKVANATALAGEAYYVLEESLTPPGPVAETFAEFQKFNVSIFASFVELSEPLAALVATPNVTLFVPTNEAFELLPKDTQVNPEHLLALIQHHILPAAVYSDSVFAKDVNLTTMGNETLFVKSADKRVGNATIVFTDLLVENGVIHVVDEILVPESLKHVLNITVEDREVDNSASAVASSWLWMSALMAGTLFLVL